MTLVKICLLISSVVNKCKGEIKWQIHIYNDKYACLHDQNHNFFWLWSKEKLADKKKWYRYAHWHADMIYLTALIETGIIK